MKRFLTEKQATTWQSILLIVTGIVLIWLSLSGQIYWYVRPDYHFFSLIMGGTALFIGYLSFFFRSKEKDSHADHHHDHDVPLKILPSFLLLFCFLLLSAYLVFFHRSALSPRAAANRGLNQNTVTGSKIFSLSPDISPLLEAGNSENYTLADWVRLFRVNPDPWSHKGKKVKVLGFVQPHDENGFYISRFVISCCTVDASPIGIFVKTRDHFPTGKWLEITGELDIVSEEMAIIPQEMKEVPQPQQPYLY